MQWNGKTISPLRFDSFVPLCSANIFADVPHLFRSSHELNIVWMSSSPVIVLCWPLLIDTFNTLSDMLHPHQGAVSRFTWPFTLHLLWPLCSSVAVDSAQCTADNFVTLSVPNWAQSRDFIHSNWTEWSFFYENCCKLSVHSCYWVMMICSFASSCFLKSLLTLHPLCQWYVWKSL